MMRNFGDSHGITPAYAGRTADLCTDADEAEDHPRIRGKNLNLCGSSIIG